MAMLLQISFQINCWQQPTSLPMIIKIYLTYYLVNNLLYVILKYFNAYLYFEY